MAATAVLLAIGAVFLFARGGAEPDQEPAATPRDAAEPPVEVANQPPPAAGPAAPPAAGPAAPPAAKPVSPVPSTATAGALRRRLRRRKKPRARTLRHPRRYARLPDTQPPIRSVLVGTNEIVKRLDKPIPLHFPNMVALEDVLKHIKSATKHGPGDPGIPIYVDPVALQEVLKSMRSVVKINVDGVPLKTALKDLFGQVGLAHLVKDDVLIVSTPRVVEALRRQQVDHAADTSPATKAAMEKLKQPIVMPFRYETPLSEVIHYIRSATKQGPGDPGIPIYVDPLGLEKARRSMQSRVVIELEGVPLKTCLELLLRQLGLDYRVKNGQLSITVRSQRPGRRN